MCLYALLRGVFVNQKGQESFIPRSQTTIYNPGSPRSEYAACKLADFQYIVICHISLQRTKPDVNLLLSEITDQDNQSEVLVRPPSWWIEQEATDKISSARWLSVCDAKINHVSSISSPHVKGMRGSFYQTSACVNREVNRAKRPINRTKRETKCNILSHTTTSHKNN